MKTTEYDLQNGHGRFPWSMRGLAMVCLAFWLLPDAAAQTLYPLAITEVMSEASGDQLPLFRGADYWELTNFGEVEILLTGFSFSDNRRELRKVADVFNNLILPAGQSIIFCRTSASPTRLTITNAASFRDWWGASNLPTGLQIREYKDPGFDGDMSEEVWLYDPENRVVDFVSIGQATQGQSFTYDPSSGIFGILSRPGDGVTFKAAASDDWGSPGKTSGSSPIKIVRQPLGQTNDIGMNAEISISACGYPQPHYQWFFQDELIEGATMPSLKLKNLSLSDEGFYYVTLKNSFSELVSEKAFLSVNTSTSRVQMIKGPSDVQLFQGQTAVFDVLTRGYPPAQYQWLTNGIELADETNSTLSIFDCSLAMSNLQISVHVWNEISETNMHARLCVITQPNLEFTEIMARPLNKALTGHLGWVELTNNGTNSFDLHGCFLSDTTATNSESFAILKTLPVMFQIDHSVVIQPRESVIFVDSMATEDFRQWWGEELPMHVKIISWHGFALGDVNDELYLWNHFATDPMNTLATASWGQSINGFSKTGVSVFTEEDGNIVSFVNNAEAGTECMYSSPQYGDLGSPGITTNSLPYFLSTLNFSRKHGDFELSCKRPKGLPFRLLCADDILAKNWIELARSNGAMVFSETNTTQHAARFYRLEECP